MWFYVGRATFNAVIASAAETQANPILIQLDPGTFQIAIGNVSGAYGIRLPNYVGLKGAGVALRRSIIRGAESIRTVKR